MELLAGDLFSGEETIEGGAANAELARGTELVIAVEFQDELDVAMNGRCEGEIVRDLGDLGLRRWAGCRRGRFVRCVQREVVGTNDSAGGVEDGGFKNRCKFADVSRPRVLQQAMQCPLGKYGGRLLVAPADAIDQGLRDGSDVFAAFAQGR